MKNILITGCTGQLGKAVNRIYAGTDHVLINTDVIKSEGVHFLDMTDQDSVVKAVKEWKPDIILNCGAMTNVDACETDYDAAIKINGEGPKNMAVAANEIGSRLVHISTDYVFRGDGIRAYKETDVPEPISAYGRSKLLGEENIKAVTDKYYIFRTAWLYGEGKNFVRTMLALSDKYKQVNVVNDQIGNPTSAMELARAIKAVIDTENYGIYHATCEGGVSWAGFAEEIFRVFGKDTIVNKVTSEEYKRMNPASARRPKMSMLENHNLFERCNYRMADWKNALIEYGRSFMII